MRWLLRGEETARDSSAAAFDSRRVDDGRATVARDAVAWQQPVMSDRSGVVEDAPEDRESATADVILPNGKCVKSTVA